ncbi:1,4-dihydroxy-2-naphthoyl-CoA thioesterase 2 [Cryptomeria japonica]|uniref:1,4-dihydroxy-2-naphthoyl-CoA thioesterase 2 n=1 Tax=Cryptomeria japonica TaxID=3369 RepID=UPI0025AB7384|nr:1,4-dihydroxy-2-naphthoyl-CoA thioesterase 2 [Cryptomeria japonica]
MDSFTQNYLQCKIPEAMMMGSPPPDLVLRPFGFQVDLVSAHCVSGCLTITESCCQPFKVLHGGVTSLIAEGLASIGAHVASGYRRIAGIELNINHLKAAPLGTAVHASAKPITLGKRIQVWEVKFWKIPASDVSSRTDSSTLPKNSVLAVSRVTFLVGLPVSKGASRAPEAVKIPSSM